MIATVAIPGTVAAAAAAGVVSGLQTVATGDPNAAFTNVDT
jgi:hypothetical protein